LCGTIVAATYMGATTRFEIACGEGLTLVADLAASAFVRGTRVRLLWEAEAATVVSD